MNDPIYMTISSDDLKEDVTFNLYQASGEAEVQRGRRFMKIFRRDDWKRRKLRQRGTWQAKLTLFVTSDEPLFGTEWCHARSSSN